MASNIGRISIAISANPSAAVSGLATVQGALIQFESSTRGLMDRLKGYFAGFALFQAGKFMVNTAANIDAARVAMQGLVGDVKEGTQLFNELRAFQQQSPFSLPEVTDASKRLLGFGVEAANVLPILRQLADVSQGNAETFGLLALVYGQIQSAGRLLGQDANQLNTHFSILKQLAKMTGMEFADLKKAMGDGAVTAEMVAAAFQSATASGGIFNNAVKNFMGTAAGKFKMLTVEATKLAETLGNILLPPILSLTKAFLTFMQSVEAMGSAKLRLITKIIAFAGVMYVSVRAIALVSSAIKSLIQMYKALASAQVVAQAFSGPKGWAAIFGGIALAGGGMLLVNEAFGEFESAIANVSTETQGLENQFKDLLAPLEKWRGAASAAGQETDKAAKSAERAAERLQDRADQLKQSLRVPLEVYRDSLIELLDLLQENMIDLETFRRGFVQARQQYLEATTKDLDKRVNVAPGIGAARRDTTEGFSAVQAAIRTSTAVAEQKQIMTKQLEAQREANRILKAIMMLLPNNRLNYDSLGID